MKKSVGRLIRGLMLASLVIPATMTQVAFAQTKEVALLTQPDGDVRLQRRRGIKNIKEGMLLDMGDVIRVYDDGTAVIYQAYVPVTRLSNKIPQFNVVRRAPLRNKAILAAEQFSHLKSQFIAAQQNKVNPSPATMGGPDDAILTLLLPRGSVVLTRRPTFAWSRVRNATKYVVNVYKKNDTLVCTESTIETQLALPGKCASLDPGDYKWDVTAQVGSPSDNPALYDATSFTVVTGRRKAVISGALRHAKAVLKSNQDAALVYITTLMEYRLYSQAEAELLQALEGAPADQSLWALLMETYAQMKRWRAREKARNISAANPTVEMVQELRVGR